MNQTPETPAPDSGDENFTEHLRKSLKDFVTNATDEEMVQAFKDADFEFYRHVKSDSLDSGLKEASSESVEVLGQKPLPADLKEIVDAMKDEPPRTQFSVCWIQRRFRIGYVRALEKARRLFELGIIKEIGLATFEYIGARSVGAATNSDSAAGVSSPKAATSFYSNFGNPDGKFTPPSVSAVPDVIEEEWDADGVEVRFSNGARAFIGSSPTAQLVANAHNASIRRVLEKRAAVAESVDAPEKAFVEKEADVNAGNAPRHNELLPCPFCGSKAELRDLGDGTGGHMIGCRRHNSDDFCGAMMTALRGQGEYSPDAVITAWNRRAAISVSDGGGSGASFNTNPTSLGEL